MSTIEYALYGNRGEYRMPSTPTFPDLTAARAYYHRFYPSGNRFIVILPVA